MSKITVVIEQGQVKAINDIPVGVYVEVRNYDVLDVKDGISKDENGRPCQIREWRAPE